jgi:3-oxoacyl-[acyl-carrier-protein] synthase-1
MSDANRVVITGMGAITASGSTLDATWDALLAGEQGISEIQHWDISSWPYRMGGEIKSFEPTKLLPDRKLLKVISRQDVWGMNAVMQAIKHSGLLEYRETLSAVGDFNERTGVFVGSPGNKYYQQYDFLPLLAKSNGDMTQFAEQLFSEVHPMWLLRILPNNVLAYTGITYGFKGVNHNIANHAVGGTQALIEAYHAIKAGQADRAVVVAYDVGTEPQSLYYYAKLGLISSTDLKPFNQYQDGTLLAEGAAAIVLESESSAKRRGAACYAEVLGGSFNSECSGLVSIESDGQSLKTLLSSTLDACQVDPKAVGIVVAHGNGNVKSDTSEAHGIESILADVPVTAFKWSMGHTLCASGIVDAALMTKSLTYQCVPGIANLADIASAYQSLSLSQTTRPLNETKPYAVLLNRGFGSMNACLVMKRYG